MHFLGTLIALSIVGHHCCRSSWWLHGKTHTIERYEMHGFCYTPWERSWHGITHTAWFLPWGMGFAMLHDLFHVLPYMTLGKRCTTEFLCHHQINMLLGYDYHSLFCQQQYFLIWNIQAPGENLLWVQKFPWGEKLFLNQTIFVLEHDKTLQILFKFLNLIKCSYLHQNSVSVHATDREWSFLERWRSFCELASFTAGRPSGRGTQVHIYQI